MAYLRVIRSRSRGGYGSGSDVRAELPPAFSFLETTAINGCSSFDPRDDLLNPPFDLVDDRFDLHANPADFEDFRHRESHHIKYDEARGNVKELEANKRTSRSNRLLEVIVFAIGSSLSDTINFVKIWLNFTICNSLSLVIYYRFR